MLALNLPFYQLEKSWEVSEAITKSELPLLPQLNEEYNEIVELYYKCLEPAPNKRPKSTRILSILKHMKTKQSPRCSSP